ncbi:MAG: SlyX family protein [Eubacterium sp.]|nr:SlyX family protein [Eubacterium sp.]
MKKSDRLRIIILGIIGLFILIGIGIFIFIGQSICTMAGVGLFVVVCIGMVIVTGKKDDQTETIEQLNQTISEQSRRIMNTEGQLARYKRELAEATGKNEA